MNRGLSIWLDVLRCLAALAVLLGHIAHDRFTRGDYLILREINIASDAVVVFFVISGVVIAYAAGRDATPQLFFFNRITRLVSVVMPALALTLLLDAIGTRIDAEAYPSPYYEDASLLDYLLRGMTLSTEWTGFFDRVRLGSNGPIWSLSYEAAYYTLFGIAVFFRGFVRLGLLTICAMVFGLPILALLPAWLMGVVVWRFLAAGRAETLSLPLAAVLAVGCPAILVAARILGLPPILTEVTANALHPYSHHVLLGYSDEVLWNMLIAAGVSLHIVGAARLLIQWRPAASSRTIISIQWLAGGTFSIYAIHYPVLHVLDAVLPEAVVLRGVLLLSLTLAAGLAFARVFERSINSQRQTLRAWLWRVRARQALER